MNWGRIIANALIAFCTSWIGANVAGASMEAMTAATVTALIIGVLAFAQELKIESDTTTTKTVNPLLLI